MEARRLPPGQRAVDGFPRFGTHMNRPAPAVPEDPAIEVAGPAAAEAVRIPLARLSGELPRRQLDADFHCVAGWSATGLHWEGVPLAALYREEFRPAAGVSHLLFEGLDGHQSVMALEDALRDEVLVADRLNGAPLDSDHGAPVRLVAPAHYGFVNVKHLCRIELHASEPEPDYSDVPLLSRVGLRSPLARPHRRARVWEEERHRYLPGRVVRPVYRSLIAPLRAIAARGSRR